MLWKICKDLLRPVCQSHLESLWIHIPSRHPPDTLDPRRTQSRTLQLRRWIHGSRRSHHWVEEKDPNTRIARCEGIAKHIAQAWVLVLVLGCFL